MIGVMVGFLAGVVVWSWVVWATTGAGIECQLDGHRLVSAFDKPGRAFVCSRCGARRLT